jgi:hypothetical protein
MLEGIASKNGERPWRVGEIQGTQWLYPAWGRHTFGKIDCGHHLFRFCSDRESQIAQLIGYDQEYWYVPVDPDEIASNRSGVVGTMKLIANDIGTLEADDVEHFWKWWRRGLLVEWLPRRTLNRVCLMLAGRRGTVRRCCGLMPSG